MPRPWAGRRVPTGDADPRTRTNVTAVTDGFSIAGRSSASKSGWRSNIERHTLNQTMFPLAFREKSALTCRRSRGPMTSTSGGFAFRASWPNRRSPRSTPAAMRAWPPAACPPKSPRNRIPRPSHERPGIHGHGEHVEVVELLALHLLRHVAEDARSHVPDDHGAADRGRDQPTQRGQALRPLLRRPATPTTSEGGSPPSRRRTSRPPGISSPTTWPADCAGYRRVHRRVHPHRPRRAACRRVDRRRWTAA